MAALKKHMFVIDYWEDVDKNFRRLEQYRISNDLYERRFFNKLITSGICFLVIRKDDKILFGPSRFIGYYNNTMVSHKFSHIYGPETNEVISFLMGYDPIQDEEIENLYYNFCDKNGLSARMSGSFGVSRKYWYKSNLDDPIYLRFEDMKVRNAKKRKKIINFDEDYNSWTFQKPEITIRIITCEIRVPLINNQMVEVHGKMVSELEAGFEFYPDDRSFIVAVNEYDKMTKSQRIIIKRNSRIKLKEIIPDYLKTYD